MPIFLIEQEVEQLLNMRDAIRLVEEAFRAVGEGRAQNRPRQRVRVQDGVLHVMPAGLPSSGYLGFKAYTAFHGQARFYFHLFDARTGEYLAIMQADRLGQIRTGAASGVATKFLARPNATVVGILGTGWQAETQLEALCRVREVQEARCFSRNEKKRRAFAERLSARLGVHVTAVASARDAVEGCDIVSTITSSGEPVLRGEWLVPGVHVNAAGGNWAHRREVDGETIRRATAIFVDSLEQAQIESGDLIIPANEGGLDWGCVQELGALVAGRAQGRVSASDVTLFKSNGVALEDVAVGGWVYEQARSKGIGAALAI